jgi:hypothetical protein
MALPGDAPPETVAVESDGRIDPRAKPLELEPCRPHRLGQPKPRDWLGSLGRTRWIDIASGGNPVLGQPPDCEAFLVGQSERLQADQLDATNMEATQSCERKRMDGSPDDQDATGQANTKLRLRDRRRKRIASPFQELGRRHDPRQQERVALHGQGKQHGSAGSIPSQAIDGAKLATRKVEAFGDQRQALLDHCQAGCQQRPESLALLR